MAAAGPARRCSRSALTGYSRRVIRGFAWAAGFTGLFLSAAHARASDRKPAPIDYAPASCAAGRLASLPRIGSDGITVQYHFAAKDIRTRAAPLATRIEEKLGLTIRYQDGLFGKSALITQRYHSSSDSGTAINASFDYLCSVMTEFGFDIDRVYITSTREFDRVERRKAEQRRRLHRKYGTVLDEPDEKEIGELLRSDWQNGFRHIFFRDAGVQFSRVREDDVKCHYVESRLGPMEDHIGCEVGVLGTSSRGPEYGKGTLTLIRSENYEAGKTNKLLVYEEKLEVIVN